MEYKIGFICHVIVAFKALKMAAMNFLSRCTAFFNRIATESLKICNSNAMHLGEKSSPPSLAQSSIHTLPVIFDQQSNLTRLAIMRCMNPAPVSVVNR